MKKLYYLLFLNLIYQITFAQKIEKEISFKIASQKNITPRKANFGMSIEQMRPFLLNMNLLNDSLMINSFLPIEGSIFKNNKEDYSSNGGHNLISSSLFNLDLEFKGLNENVAVGNTYQIDKNSEVRESGKGGSKYPVISFNTFYKKNKQFLNPPQFTFDIGQNGGGMMKTKNSFLNLSMLNYDLFGFGFGKFRLDEPKLVPINLPEWANKTKNLYVNTKIAGNTKINDNLYLTIVNRVDSDDNQWTLRHFAIIIFDKNGKIINIQNIDFEFIRMLNSVINVYDQNGEKVGVMITFQNDSEMVGQKKKKDPLKNKFNVIYINNTGQIEIKSDIVLGNEPDNSDYFNPYFAKYENNQLVIFNNMLDYTIKKNTSSFDRITIEKNGEHNVENILSKFKKPKGYFIEDLSMNSPLYFKGSYYQAGIVIDKEAPADKKFKASIVSKIDGNLKDTEIIECYNDGPQKDIIISGLEVINDDLYAITCFADGNRIQNITKGTPALNITYKKEFMPLSSHLFKNYVFDKKSQKLFFLLESINAGEAKLIKVGF